MKPVNAQRTGYRHLRHLWAIGLLLSGPALADEVPLPGDTRFAAEVQAWCDRTSASQEDAVLFTTLAWLPNPGAEVQALLQGARAGQFSLSDDARSQWLGRLAQRLFGPNGPRVEGLVAG